jgi:hypothetical protein
MPPTPGEQWVSEEGIVHIRGQINTAQVVSTDARANGINVVTINLNIDPATGNGTGHGQFILDVDGMDGAWEGTFVGWLTYGVFSGRIIGHGTGDLAGQKVKSNFQQTAQGVYAHTGIFQEH